MTYFFSHHSIRARKDGDIVNNFPHYPVEVPGALFPVQMINPRLFGCNSVDVLQEVLDSSLC